MEDMKVIRKANLNLLITQRALRDVEVLTIINGHGAASGLKAMNSPQLTELRHNPNKSFGEKMARRIEAAFGLPRGFLDEPQTPEAANAAFAASKPAQGDAFFRPTPSAAGERLLQLFETLPELLADGRTKRQLYSKLVRLLDSAHAALRPAVQRGSEPSPEPNAKPRASPEKQTARSRPRP